MFKFKFTDDFQNDMKLIPIKKQCDNSHKHCYEIIQMANKSTQLITQEYFNDFIKLVSIQNVWCLSPHYNSKYNEIKKFILNNSKKFKINKFDSFIIFMNDNETYDIIIDQQKFYPNLIDELINLEVIQNNYGGGLKINFLNLLITNQLKLKTFEYIIMSMTLNEFSKYLDKINKNFQSSVDVVINNFILKNKNNLMQKENAQIGIKLLNTIITKSHILTNIYPLISENISLVQKKEIFNKSILTYDKNLILLMLEKKDIILDINTINKLIEKSYPRPEGSPNSKIIAEIIDLLCDYGLVINKQITIKLLEHGCYINNFEKYGIKKIP